MKGRRIIPCLDVLDGRTVKGVCFEGMRYAGDPVEMARLYMEEGADELVVLDISAGGEDRGRRRSWISEVSRIASIPLVIGGGISSAEEAQELVSLGARRISINSAAVKRPGLIGECVEALGRGSVVLAVDVRRNESGGWEVFTGGGGFSTGLDAFEWMREGVRLGCGEILLTSIDRDGDKNGYDLDLLSKAVSSVPAPIIASGGAGRMEHFLDAFLAGCDGALAASVFHFGDIRIGELKGYLARHGVPVRSAREAS
ncbi:MAG: imidazole glycerol phosphate synthase subunit HisF [Synergistaceae bacterium]|nr:imidazole glycerol phosphate synthase cyclase subunit [Synergistota bacterium]NLM71223.1 imidazole glycerol phosphate synthase subunit HisF [Synergistaceae bacterium]